VVDNVVDNVVDDVVDNPVDKTKDQITNALLPPSCGHYPAVLPSLSCRHCPAVTILLSTYSHHFPDVTVRH
jgi:hypothetical protein